MAHQLRSSSGRRIMGLSAPQLLTSTLIFVLLVQCRALPDQPTPNQQNQEQGQQQQQHTPKINLKSRESGHQPSRDGFGAEQLDQEEQEPSTLGTLDISVERLEGVIRAIAPIQNPVRLVFGLALLLHGRSFHHIILFTHAFKISGWPVLKKVAMEVQASYNEKVQGHDKSQINPVKITLASLRPQQVLEVVSGIHYGLVTCLAAVVSPVAGATGVGLSLGQSLDKHLQPFLRQYLLASERVQRLRDPGMRQWVHLAAAHTAEAAGVIAALSTMSVVNVISGCLVGAELLVHVGLHQLQYQLRRFSKRSNHALLRKAATNFDPKAVSTAGLTYTLALSGFLLQMRRGAGTHMYLPLKVLLCVPLVLEQALATLKWALLAGRTPRAA